VTKRALWDFPASHHVSLTLAHLMSCLRHLPAETLYVGTLHYRALHVISPDVPGTLNIARGHVRVLPLTNAVAAYVIFSIHIGPSWAGTRTCASSDTLRHRCCGQRYEATYLRRLLQTQSNHRMTLLWQESGNVHSLEFQNLCIVFVC
jgi:hypothetical protein